MMKEEALKLADELDALHQYVPSEAPAMIRRLVEELENQKETIRKLNKTLGFINSGYEVINLEPQTKLFTDDEIKEIIGGYGNEGGIGGYTRELFDKIEAKIREKNDRK